MKWLMKNLNDFSLAEYESAYKNLSLLRKQRIDAKKNKTSKKQSLAAEITLKTLLSEEFLINDAKIDTDQKGAPYLENSNLSVSIAHCKDYVVAAVNEDLVGIDIEYIRPVSVALIKRVCTKNEQDFVFFKEDLSCLKKVTDPKMLERFFEIWTAKEAYFKMIKSGIISFKSVEVFSLNRTVFKKDGFIIQIVQNKTA